MMSDDQYLSYQTRITQAATVEELDALSKEIHAKYPDDGDAQGLLDSCANVRAIIQEEDGIEPEQEEDE